MGKTVLVSFTLVTVLLASICHGSAIEIEEEDKHNLNLALDKNGSPLLYCKNGKIMGEQEIVAFYRNLEAVCQGPSDNSTYYNCLAETLGMTDEDGAPQMENIEIVIRRVISYKILNKVPKFKEQAHFCAADYVTNYDLSDHERENAAKIYFTCFVDALKRIGEEIRGNDSNPEKFFCG